MTGTQADIEVRERKEGEGEGKGRDGGRREGERVMVGN